MWQAPNSQTKRWPYTTFAPSDRKISLDFTLMASFFIVKIIPFSIHGGCPNPEFFI